MFIPVADLIKNLPKRSRIPEAFLAIHARKALEEAVKKQCADLPEEVLRDLLAKAKFSTFKNRVLTMKVSTLLAAELQMRSGKLIREINEILGRRAVNKLRFRAG